MMLSKVLTGKLTFTSLKPLDLSDFTRQELKDYFNNSYDLNESLFVSLKDDSVMYKVPDRLRLPLIFYYTHTACVFVNKLILAGLMENRVNLEFETMFETGVDEMSWDDTENYRMGGSYKWPSVEAVVDYRRQVRNVILGIIDSVSLNLPVHTEHPLWALFMGMEHERIHFETSSVLIRQLPVDMVTRPDGWVYGPSKHDQRAGENKLVRVAEQEVTFGKPLDFPSFGWDNEYGEVTCVVPEFEGSQYLITNREFLEFVKAGGYLDDSLWTDEGLAWMKFKQALHPVFWSCDQGCNGGCGGDIAGYSHCRSPDNGGEKRLERSDLKKTDTVYRYRLMFDEIDIPLDWPVSVNYHEARAYCAWRGPEFRLPTEAEHNVMRGPQAPPTDGVSSDIIFKEKLETNFNLQYGSSTPVNLYNATAAGFYDVSGNVWEWMEDHFNGLHGFNSHWLYDDFSSPCFDGRHNIILGGSWASTGVEGSRFARYSFRRHFIQHCGFRVVCSVNTSEGKPIVPAHVVQPQVFIIGAGMTENEIHVKKQGEPKLNQTTNTQFAFEHDDALYGIIELEFGFRDSYAQVIADTAMSYVDLYKCEKRSAVHVGAGLGKTAFTLSPQFNSVVGIDYSGRFVNTALTLQKDSQFSHRDVYGREINVALDSNINTNNILFKQLTWIPNELGQHDLVLLSFLDRALHPKAWLVRMWEIVSDSGIIVVVSRDGWGHQKLAEVFGQRLKFVTSSTVEYEMIAGRHQAQVTVWKRVISPECQ